MRVFALSDVHADYEANARWLAQLSLQDFQDDVLLLAGDVSDSFKRLGEVFETLRCRFAHVAYVPGNHDLWVRRDEDEEHSFSKFERIRALAAGCGIEMDPLHAGTLSIVPLLGWYDYTFGMPGARLHAAWADYRTCRWPENFGAGEITAWFTERNEPALGTTNETVISFSHFLPRLDLLPLPARIRKSFLHPVLGTVRLERQIRRLRPQIHVYGHSHVNRRVHLDGVLYVNNALGYPHETHIAARELLCVHAA